MSKAEGWFEDLLTKRPIASGMYYDRDGQELNLAAWCALAEDPDYRFVSKKFGDVIERNGVRYRISSVWLGLNMSVMPDEPPSGLFRTGVFKMSDSDPQDFGQIMWEWRWDTEAETLERHAQLLENPLLDFDQF